jgi:hypothetical protein
MFKIIPEEKINQNLIYFYIVFVTFVFPQNVPYKLAAILDSSFKIRNIEYKANQ